MSAGAGGWAVVCASCVFGRCWPAFQLTKRKCLPTFMPIPGFHSLADQVLTVRPRRGSASQSGLIRCCRIWFGLGVRRD